MYADEFNYDKIWKIEQVEIPYQHDLKLSEKRTFSEGEIGCNHRCLFCGYTWQRKFISPHSDYRMGYGLFQMEDKERAMLDLDKDPNCIDWAHLRTTAIDGFSERIRCGVNKRITSRIIHQFLTTMLAYQGAPHQLKLFNICGYPTETEEDWREFLEELRRADMETPRRERQWSIVLHSTPFRPHACHTNGLRLHVKAELQGPHREYAGPGTQGRDYLSGAKPVGRGKYGDGQPVHGHAQRYCPQGRGGGQREYRQAVRHQEILDGLQRCQGGHTDKVL